MERGKDWRETKKMERKKIGKMQNFFQEERLAAAAGCLVPLSTILEETIAYTKVGCFYLRQLLPSTSKYFQAYILKASDVAVMAILAKKNGGKFGLKLPKFPRFGLNLA